jgi:E3 ubiquitin-protein ligase RNF13
MVFSPFRCEFRPTRHESLYKMYFYLILMQCTKFTVAGSSTGIHIYSVFVSKSSGETLAQYANRSDVEVWIIPTFENSAWSVLAISFISLLAMSAVLATCFFVRRHRIRRERPGRGPDVREFHGMSSQLVKAMPSVVFTVVSEESCTASTCAICLEDYCVGDKLRILPCRHSKYMILFPSFLTFKCSYLYSSIFFLISS